MVARDECSDTARTGGGTTGRGGYLMPQDFRPTTIAEQNMMGGFNRTDLPVGGEPNRQRVSSGSAEAE